jgi:peptidoglycan/LPS O-acetylase OafA/YrhL
VRSSTGQYYPGLDHLRALAAFLVFGWHFSHGFHGRPAPFGQSLTPFLAPFNEGHCGVALFMCLSGYLFAKILDGKQIIWRGFYWNRCIRLAPLLIVVFLLRGALVAHDHPGAVEDYVESLATGFVRPMSWPNGAWSIVVEIHFYFLLWIIIPLKRRWLPSLFGFLAAGLVVRFLIYEAGGDVAYYAYGTIAGRIDQFVLGIAAWEFRGLLRGRHLWMGIATVAFFSFYQWFVSIGGFYATQGARAVWIFIPTIEAGFFSFLIAYYDGLAFSRRWYWRLVEAIGAASFSIYLLHIFVVFALAQIASFYLPAMATWEVAEAVAVAAFAAILPVAWLSYRFVERPFLRFRRKYTGGDGGRVEQYDWLDQATGQEILTRG